MTANGQQWSTCEYILKLYLTSFGYRLDAEVRKRKESETNPRFWAQATGRMELALTEGGRLWETDLRGEGQGYGWDNVSK